MASKAPEPDLELKPLTSIVLELVLELRLLGSFELVLELRLRGSIELVRELRLRGSIELVLGSVKLFLELEHLASIELMDLEFVKRPSLKLDLALELDSYSLVYLPNTRGSLQNRKFGFETS